MQVVPGSNPGADLLLLLFWSVYCSSELLVRTVTGSGFGGTAPVPMNKKEVVSMQQHTCMLPDLPLISTSPARAVLVRLV